MIKDHDLDDVRSTEVPKYRSVSSSRSEKGQPVGRRGSRRSSWCPHSSHLAVQLLHDACGVVLGALDEQRLALVPETDHAGSLPFAEMPGARLEVRMWLEAQGASVLDGPEHHVLCQFEGGCERLIGVGAEHLEEELGQLAPVQDVRAEGVLHPQA